MDKVNNFFRVLYNGCGEDHFAALWLKSSKTTKRFRVSQLDEAVNEARAQSAATDVYFGVGLQSEDLGPLKRGNVENISAIPGLWFDLDIAGGGHKSSGYPGSIAEAMEFLQGLPLPPSGVVNSGGGLHGYWMLAHPWQFANDDDRKQAQELSRSFQSFIIEEGRKG